MLIYSSAGKFQLNWSEIIYLEYCLIKKIKQKNNLCWLKQLKICNINYLQTSELEKKLKKIINWKDYQKSSF